MKHPSLVLTLLLFLAALPVWAQWSGRLDVTTGLGVMKGNKELGVGMLGHVLTQGDVSLRYKTDAFAWNTTVGLKWEPKSTDNSRMNIHLGAADAIGLELVYKTVKTRPLETSFRSTFDWKPSADQNYSAWVSYRYKYDHARNVSNSLTGILSIEDTNEEKIREYYSSPQAFVENLTLDAMYSYLASCYYELATMNGHRMGTGASGEWQLGEKSRLLGSFSLMADKTDKYNIWSVFKTDGSVWGEVDEGEAFRDGAALMYRITPDSFDMDFNADLHLRHAVREDSVRFRWLPGVRFMCKHSLDRNSGATLVDMDSQGGLVWQDSLRLRETFNFLTLTAAPFVAAEYRGKALEVQADYSAQFYFRRLNDDTHRQRLGLASVSPVGNARLSWKITPVHKLGITHDIGVNYPDYLKICWYERTGGYADQLYRGNADLAATLFSRYGLEYELKYKRFRYRTVNTVTRTLNEMDQTWSNEIIEGHLYKVFYWVNSADSWAFGTAHRVGWEGKWIKAGTGVEYKWSRRTAKADGAIKDASNWLLTGDVEANLGKGWSAGARFKHQTKVVTLFTTSNEYWDLSAHLQKKFKTVTLYLDGRDLLDNARKTVFESADGKEYWVDVVRNNRRLVLLGIQWNF